jgi:hypothetical protein
MAATYDADAFLCAGHKKAMPFRVKSLASHGTDAREQVVLNLCSEAKCDVEPRLLAAALKAAHRRALALAI